MFNTLKNLKNKYQSSNTWADFFLSLTGLDEMYKKLDEAKNDKEWRKIAEEVLAKQKEQIEKLLKEVEKLEWENKEKDERIKELEQSQIISANLEKLEESERNLEAQVVKLENKIVKK